MSEQDAPDAADDETAQEPDDTVEDTEGSPETTDREDGANLTDGEFPLSDVDATFDDADFEAEFGDEVPDEVIERVEESDADSIAHELTALRKRVNALEDQLEAREEELDDVMSTLKRKQADFENYKKRMKKRREQEKQRATEDLVENLLDVRDNLVRALDLDDPDAEDVREGVESTLREFDRILDDENVTVVEPDPGREVDPQRHEVLMRVDSDKPEDTVADVHRPGYIMADKVLRPAQVTVSDGAVESDDDGDTAE